MEKIMNILQLLIISNYTSEPKMKFDKKVKQLKN